jgi:beta-aspartyl-peptidase (threonine type)
MAKLAIAIHGGAGTIFKSQMTPDLENEYRSGLETALMIGWTILANGGSSLDAVEAAVVSLEDFPLFNAGRGSVFTHEGKQEMDASIMDGASLRAGGVAFIRNIKNPIKLARLVMERTEHVLIAGDGANQFAQQQNVETAPDEYFFTEHRWLQYQEALVAGRVQLDHAVEYKEKRSGREGESEPGAVATGLFDNPKSKIQTPKSLGTVGAVACDLNGHLAAATSTGGMTNKKFGRIGDTPLVGAGTYADNVCAVSCTGHGEYFMRGVTAYDVAARMKYAGSSLEEAAQKTIERVSEIHGDGGLIAVDALGNVALPFNSEGMYRGFITDGMQQRVEIYR